MAAVIVTTEAIRDLERLSLVLTLPESTRTRVRRTLATLESFPLLGAHLFEGYRNYRFVLGPWRWMLIIYYFDESADSVVVVSILDARSAESPTRS